jgi:hypothetical protein
LKAVYSYSFFGCRYDPFAVVIYTFFQNKGSKFQEKVSRRERPKKRLDKIDGVCIIDPAYKGVI